MSFFNHIFLGITLLLLTGCPTSSTSSSITTISPSPSSTSTGIPSGPMAAQILFQNNTGGSFNSPANNSGTVPTPGSGQPAVRLFNPDGTLLAYTNTNGNTSNWPQWLQSFELGLSGSSNSSSSNPNCARFASSSESSQTNCSLGSCGASAGLFRVSEADCATTSPGNGGPQDGIYLRAVFNRTQLGPSENILVVLQYSASYLDAIPSNPTSCFTLGNFTPETCSNFVWKTYLKHSSTETVFPFLMLIPPAFNPSSTATTGTSIHSKQLILPLAADQNLSVLQISRIQSNFSSNLASTCATGGYPANSPLCAGVVFYSMTFYRI